MLSGEVGGDSRGAKSAMVVKELESVFDAEKFVLEVKVGGKIGVRKVELFQQIIVRITDET